MIINLAKINEQYKTVPYQSKPDSLSLEEWQIALRRQFAERHSFVVENNGVHPVFSDFVVSNPESNSRYKVAIRSGDYSMNFCECMDFKTNGLGSCKHIEAVLLRIQSNEAHKHILECNFQPNYSSVHVKYGGQRDIKFRLGYENEQAFKALAAEYFDENDVLKPESYQHFETFLHKAVAISSSFRCYPDALERIIQIREQQKRNVQTTELRQYIATGLIDAELFDYQVDGVLFAYNAGRCLLADDMGLGKTIQAIATAQLLQKEQNIESVFIICPTSLKYQWKSEIERFTKSSALIIEGSSAKRAEQYQNKAFVYKIMSYNILLTDLMLVNKLEPDLIIIDEAQKIKNFKSKISKQVKLLKSPYAIALSGTPLENKLEELYSIMQFVDSYSLGPYYQFMNYHLVRNEQGKIIGYQHLHHIRERLQNVLLRRTRTSVLSQLPARIVKNLLIQITTPQMDIHNEYKREVAKLIEKWKRSGVLNEIDRNRLITSLNTMRMVCDSTFLVDQKTRHDTKIDELMNIVDELIEQGPEKLVVFSQWERMTRLVARELANRNIQYCYLHGNVTAADRGKMLEQFSKQADCRVFLSTDTGSIGLNLQAASILVNLDIPWNPAILEQRISRIHRLGQQQSVSIINFIAAGTIEQRMLDVLSFKDALAKGVLDFGDDSIFMSESAFKTFIGTLDTMIDFRESVSTVSEKEELHDVSTVEKTEPQQLHLFEDDDVEPSYEFSQTDDNFDELLTSGVTVLSRFADVFADDKKREQLLQTLFEQDANSGKSYLKIPVENEQTAQNMFRFIASFLSQYQTKNS